MPDNLFTWDAWAIQAGASFMTFFITSYTKRIIDRYWSWGTDLFAVIIGSTMILLSLLATEQRFSWQMVALSIFNGFLVAATAGKMNDKTIQELDRRMNTECQDVICRAN